jgi:transcription elongation factor Elf1
VRKQYGHPIVRRGFPCPKCEKDDAFITKVRLGDYSEMSTEACEECGYKLTKEEEQDMCDQAWESGPEDYAGEMADYLYDRSRDR